MTDGESLLAGILAEPWSDVRRKVYADYLADYGELERGAFIHTQVEAAREADPGRRAELERAADALTAGHADSWVPRVNALWGWVRGFVERIDGITAADWLEHADAILAAHPVRFVRLTTWPDAIGLRYGRTDLAVSIMERRHPGIAFEFPPPPPAAFTPYTGADFTPMFQGMYEAGRRSAEAMNEATRRAVAGIGAAFAPLMRAYSESLVTLRPVGPPPPPPPPASALTRSLPALHPVRESRAARRRRK